MPLERQSGRPLTGPLANRVSEDASSAQIVTAVGELWLELDAALSPIVGPRGVAALWQRGLQVAAADHPWLAAGQPDRLGALDQPLLYAVLAQRDSDEAAAAVTCLLQAFHALLASLIGLSLTERLLRTVWGPPLDAPSSGLPAQDPTR